MRIFQDTFETRKPSFFSAFSICITVPLIIEICTAWKVFKYGVFSCPYFPVFGLNAEIYSVNLHIQSKYRKIWTRKNSVFRHFLRSDEVAIEMIHQRSTLRKLLPVYPIKYDDLNLVYKIHEIRIAKVLKSSHGGKIVDGALFFAKLLTYSQKDWNSNYQKWTLTDFLCQKKKKKKKKNSFYWISTKFSTGNFRTFAKSSRTSF